VPGEDAHHGPDPAEVGEQEVSVLQLPPRDPSGRALRVFHEGRYKVLDMPVRAGNKEVLMFGL
jgi:hypothetical protein